ncbi:MAG: FAD-binding oxidoreductase, partial [Rhodobacteraceae bacterium]|nr:FAD-binding oxidoreductase [Paracoccaceae bacterium]
MADGNSFAGFGRLRQSLSGALFDDGFTRGRYATDASIYQMMPHGVVIPKTIADIEATIAFCREQGMALLPRGGGTSQCGQTVGEALVIDTSKYLRSIKALDVERQRAVV